MPPTSPAPPAPSDFLSRLGPLGHLPFAICHSSHASHQSHPLGLLQADDPSGFIDCMVEHFENLTRFTKVVDEIFAVCRRRWK